MDKHTYFIKGNCTLTSSTRGIVFQLILTCDPNNMFTELKKRLVYDQPGVFVKDFDIIQIIKLD